MSDNSGVCYRCCCRLIITSGLAALFMWLSLRTSNPKCLIQDFYVPALNTTDNSNSSATNNNHTISLHLRLENVMKDKGVFYDDLNVTIFYGVNNTFLLIANDTVDGFRQGNHKKANKIKLVKTYGVPWKDAYKEALNNDSVFRVDLATKIRFNILFWSTRKHHLVVGANVTVNYSGEKSGNKKKGITMKSGVADHRCYAAGVKILILLHFVILF